MIPENFFSISYELFHSKKLFGAKYSDAQIVKVIFSPN